MVHAGARKHVGGVPSKQQQGRRQYGHIAPLEAGRKQKE